MVYFLENNDCCKQVSCLPYSWEVSKEADMHLKMDNVKMMNDSSLGIKDMFMLPTVTHSGHRLFSVRILKMAIERFLLWSERKEYLFIVGM